MTDATTAQNLDLDLTPYTRYSGLLLHPTSLPGPYGIGELGSAAFQFIDFLADAEQNLWQVMPLGPTGYGDSPYQSFSSFAGNPLLISLERLMVEGRLIEADLEDMPEFPHDRVDYGPVIEWRNAVLRKAYARFKERSNVHEWKAVSDFATANRRWLEDFALFMALKERFSVGWIDWPQEIATRQAEAMAKMREELADDIFRHVYLQYEFDRQWSSVREYARSKSIQIIGDMPIYVAFDSSDAWAQPEIFWFDEDRKPIAVAGVPPDYFSATGQLWGNPLYRWDVLEETGYRWWIERFRQAFRMFDIVRIDHFRGFEAYWAVPADEETAENGTWEPGPGATLFEAVNNELGSAPIIAEDLGVITPGVEALRDSQGFPGMKVLQFAFSANAANPYLPHHHIPNCVIYTGTHDNDTTVGWFNSATEGEREYTLDYLGTTGAAINWDFIRLALMSVARWAVFPMQDLIGAGSEGRMNTPGQPSGNWGWRLTDVPTGAQERLRRLTRIYGRGPVSARLAASAAVAAEQGVDLAVVGRDKTGSETSGA